MSAVLMSILVSMSGSSGEHGNGPGIMRWSPWTWPPVLIVIVAIASQWRGADFAVVAAASAAAVVTLAIAWTGYSGRERWKAAMAAMLSGLMVAGLLWLQIRLETHA